MLLIFYNSTEDTGAVQRAMQKYSLPKNTSAFCDRFNRASQ